MEMNARTDEHDRVIFEFPQLHVSTAIGALMGGGLGLALVMVVGLVLSALVPLAIGVAGVVLVLTFGYFADALLARFRLDSTASFVVRPPYLQIRGIEMSSGVGAVGWRFPLDSTRVTWEATGGFKSAQFDVVVQDRSTRVVLRRVHATEADLLALVDAIDEGRRESERRLGKPSDVCETIDSLVRVVDRSRE